ncbi:MAG: AraC family transcriptional regulator [Rudanella sp.]|nr:AraC family transcriptional regulator [Rudanella sp.]
MRWVAGIWNAGSKRATSNTVNEYIQRVKVEAAEKDFESSRKTINEVMYDVGYSDNEAFRLVFKNSPVSPPSTIVTNTTKKK